MIYAAVLAGGIGSRMGRTDKPKQFLSLSPDGKSFLRLAYDRFSKIVPADHVLVVSQVRYEEMVRETLPEVPDENIILEPLSRNTAPCIALAAFKLLLRDPDALLIRCRAALPQTALSIVKRRAHRHSGSPYSFSRDPQLPYAAFPLRADCKAVRDQITLPESPKFHITENARA